MLFVLPPVLLAMEMPILNAILAIMAGTYQVTLVLRPVQQVSGAIRPGMSAKVILL